MYQDELQAQQAYDNTKDCASTMGQTAVGRAPYTLREEAEAKERGHYEEASKAGQAARFLRAHPEFDEFIRLVRSGSIHF